MIDDRYRDATRFFFRFSADGLEWTDFDALDVPREHLDQSPITGQDDYQIDPPYALDSRVASNGEYLVVAVAWPPGQGAWFQGSDDAIDGPTPQSRVYVSVTDDLTDWDTTEVLTSPPDFLHQSLRTHFDITDLEVTQGGWLLGAVTSAYMDLPSLVPAEIRRSASGIRTVDYDGEGATFEWTASEDDGSADAEPQTGHFSWDELGTTLDLYLRYGIDGLTRNKPYIPYLGNVRFCLGGGMG